jgi:hypothetical protein
MYKCVKGNLAQTLPPAFLLWEPQKKYVVGITVNIFSTSSACLTPLLLPMFLKGFAEIGIQSNLYHLDFNF